MKKRRNGIVLLIFLFLLAGVIFAFSAQNAEKSGNISEYFTKNFLQIFHITDVSIGKAERFLRKAAHFAEFFLLGALLCLWIWRFRKGVWFTGTVSFAIAFAYAVLDEGHQYFIPGRSASLKDVLLDGAGALCGVLLVLAIEAAVCFVRRKRSEKVNKSYENKQ